MMRKYEITYHLQRDSRINGSLIFAYNANEARKKLQDQVLSQHNQQAIIHTCVEVK